jgi:hypothetical protein
LMTITFYQGGRFLCRLLIYGFPERAIVRINSPGVENYCATINA